MGRVLEKVNAWSERPGALWVILGISAAVKFSLALMNGDINPDGDDYIFAAQQVIQGNLREGMKIYPMPFYPFLIGIFHFLIPNWVWAARAVNVLSLIFSAIPLYLLTKELFGKGPAFWAGLAFALAPYPTETSVEVVRGPVFVLCFGWAAYFSVRAVRTKRKLFFLAGSVFALTAALFRVEGVLLPVLCPLFFLWLAVSRKGERRALLRGIAIWVVFPVLLCLAVYVGTGRVGVKATRMNEVNKKIHGILDLRFLDNYHRIYDQLKDLEEKAVFPGGKQNLAEIARHAMPLLYLYGLSRSLAKVLFPLFVIPLVLGFRRPHDRGHGLVLFVASAYFFMVYLTLVEQDYIQDRFLLATAYLLYPWVGSGMYRLVNPLAGSRARRIIGAAVAVLLVFSPLVKTTELFAEQEDVMRRAGRWIASEPSLRELKMMSTDSRIPFYAGRGGRYVDYDEQPNGEAAMERLALRKNVGLITLESPDGEEGRDPIFSRFEKRMEFQGKKERVVVYVLRERPAPKKGSVGTPKPPL